MSGDATERREPPNKPVTFAEKQSMRRRDRPECNRSGHHCDGWCQR